MSWKKKNVSLLKQVTPHPGYIFQLTRRQINTITQNNKCQQIKTQTLGTLIFSLKVTVFK
jgi:hypothetical protein